MSPRRRKLPVLFDTRKRGLNKVMGDLEADVMEEAWRSGEVSVRDIHETVGSRRKLAYTTVMTVMSRLAEKGLLRRRNAGGKAWLYTPAMSREEFTRETAGSVLSGLLSDFATLSMSQFVDLVSAESEDRMKELEKIVAERRKKKK